MLAKLTVASRLATMLVVPLATVIALAALGASGSAVAPWVFVLVGIAGIAGSLLVTVAVSRTLVRPLRELATAAEDIAEHHLPAAVAWLQAGREEWAAPIGELDVGAGGELGRLAAAFDRVKQVSVSTAQQQGALVRRGISDLFVNLTRRNQELLTRQIEYIDRLEADEADPDRLEGLFRLDHLATRMRRNTESLLVLAGAEPARRSGRPVELGEVVRMAVSEVAEYPRIRLAALDDVMVSSAAAVDTAHLLAELLENAALYSPPDRSVEVSGTVGEQGGYLVTVSDEGLGFAPDALARANAVLENPPLIGLDLGPSLGFVVVGRVAQRHGITVRLSPGAHGGTTATVTLPAGVAARMTRADDAPPAALIAPTPPVAPPALITTPAALSPVQPPAPVPASAPAVEPVPVGEAASVVPTNETDDGSDPDAVHGQAMPPVRSLSIGRVPPLPPVGTTGTGLAVDTPAPVTDELGVFTHETATDGYQPHHDEVALAQQLAHAEDSTRAAGFGLAAEFELVEEFELLEDTGGSGTPATPLTPEETAARLGSLFSTASMVAAMPPIHPAPPPAVPEPGPAPELGSDLGPVAPVTSIVDAASRFAGPSIAERAGNEHDDEGIIAGATPLPSRRPSAGLISRPLASVSTDGPAGRTSPDEGSADDAPRSPRQQLRELSRSSEVTTSPRVVASQRSPEEVRRMLSRYRSGLEQGRTAAFTPPGTPTTTSEAPPAREPGLPLRPAPPPPPPSAPSAPPAPLDPAGAEPRPGAEHGHTGEDGTWPR